MRCGILRRHRMRYLRGIHPGLVFSKVGNGHEGWARQPHWQVKRRLLTKALRGLCSLRLAPREREGVHGRLDQGKRIMVEDSWGRFESHNAVLRVASTTEARPIPDRHIEHHGRRAFVFYEHISHSSKDVARARPWRGYSTRLSMCQSVGRRGVKRRRTLSRTNEGRELAEHVGYYGGR